MQMPKLAYFVIAALAVATLSTPGAAQNARSFVSGQGNDNNACTLAAPCRTFAYALTQTSSGGEIVPLDSAGYGPMTIGQSVAITVPSGIDAGITATGGGNAITVNGSGIVVNLRGLVLEGGGSGVFGIEFQAGAELDVQNCLIRGFTDSGIFAGPTASATLTVTDTIASDNGTGFYVYPSTTAAASITAFFTRDQAVGNSDKGFFLGVLGSGGLAATVVDSAAIGNTNYGFDAVLATKLTIVDSAASFNGTGLTTGGVGLAGKPGGSGGTIFLQQSTISNNGSGYDITSGTINSFGNNAITDTNNTGTLTQVSLQ
jgi:hypothetical protein